MLLLETWCLSLLYTPPFFFLPWCSENSKCYVLACMLSFLLRRLYIFYFYLCVLMIWGRCPCEEVRGHLCGVGFLVHLCRFQGWKSVSRFVQQVLSPSEPSCWHSVRFKSHTLKLGRGVWVCVKFDTFLHWNLGTPLFFLSPSSGALLTERKVN